MTTVADYLMDAAVEHGIRHCFIVPGGHAMFLNEAADHHADLELVHVHHEQAAAAACEAYYRASGQMAMCLVTAGPGVTNAITGVAAAFLDAIPMLVLSGQLKRDDLGITARPSFTPLLPTTTLVKPITAYAALVTGPSEVRQHVAKAMAAVHRGPVWLDVPLDVQASEL